MASGEQMFDSITHPGQEVPNSSDKVELIENDRGDRKKASASNGDSPREEGSPLHQHKATNSLLHGSQNQGLRVIIVSSVVFAAAVTIALILTIYLEPKQVHGHAAVACDDVRCSNVGLNILRDGGNAVDAAVAAALCQGVVSPAHSGIGGGGLALVHDHKFMQSHAYNFRETAPAAATVDMMAGPGADRSIQSTGVPGQLKGLATMHQKHGKLAWHDVVEPAIQLAREFVVSEAFEKEALAKVTASDFTEARLRDVLVKPDGTLLVQGDNITIPGLVDTLREIQNDPDALYSGSLAQQFVEEVQQLGGLITKEDMLTYAVDYPDVIMSKFQDLTVVGLPPPSSGAIIGLILNIVDQLDWPGKGVQYGDLMMYHQLLEALKYAYAQKGLLEDPAFNSSMLDTAKGLLDKDFAKELADKIMENNMTLSDQSEYGPISTPGRGGTTHISVVDSAEMMVSLTTTVDDMFGNKKLLSSGIILNNQIWDFNSQAKSSQDINSIEPGKRPQSSMSPTVIYNSDHPCNHRLVIGASNGTRIISGLAETIINSLVYGMNITAAIGSPRVHPDTIIDVVEYERELPQSIVEGLGAMGHTMASTLEGLSVVQAIDKSNDDIEAQSDPRKFGEAAVF